MKSYELNHIVINRSQEAKIMHSIIWPKIYRGDNECKQSHSKKLDFCALTLKYSPLNLNIACDQSQSCVLERSNWSDSTFIEVNL